MSLLVNRDRRGLREAMAACRAGDVLVVTKLDRLARSLPDARDIVAEVESDLIKMRTREGMKVARATIQSPLLGKGPTVEARAGDHRSGNGKADAGARP